MTKELIDRLRLGASISRERNLNLDYAKVADDAADAIESLQARCAELEAQWRQFEEYDCDETKVAYALADALRAERDKLASELQALREQVPKLIEAYGGDLDNVPAAPVPPVQEPLTDDQCREIYNAAMELPNRSLLRVMRYIERELRK